MSREFDRLLRDSAPPLPDAGEARRLNRALMLRTTERSERRRRPRYLLRTAAIALLLVTLGPIAELGSDHFEFGEKTVGKYLGTEIYYMGHRNRPVIVQEGMTLDEALEFSIANYMDEGVFKGISGLFMDDGGRNWLLEFSIETGGRPSTRTRDPSGYPTVPSPKLKRFSLEMTRSGTEYQTLLKNIPGPPPRKVTASFEGVDYELNWRRIVLPEYGPIDFFELDLQPLMSQ